MKNGLPRRHYTYVAACETVVAACMCISAHSSENSHKNFLWKPFILWGVNYSGGRGGYLPLNFGFWKIVSWNKSSFFWNFRFRQKISFSWCCLGNSKKSIHIFFVFSRYITFSLAWISLNFRLAKTWICEETCFLVRVFPVLNLMYLAMSSFRHRIQIISSLLFLKSLVLDIVNISFKSFELYGHKMSPGRSNNFFSWVSGPKYEQQVCM